MTNRKVSFGRVFWPSFLATLLVAIVVILLSVLILGGAIAGLTSEKVKSYKDGTVLHLTLQGPISEKSHSDIDPVTMRVNKTVGLSELLYGFEMAKKDDRIRGVFLELDGVSCRMATAHEIREAINDFEQSGKFVIAYNAGEIITQKEYYISSAANTCYGFPSSMMEFVGLGAELTFFKNTLEKVGVEMQVVRGRNNDFKSAVEPFFRESMSDSSRLQTERYVSLLWKQMREDIAHDRKMSSEKLNHLAENLDVKNPKEAVKHGLMDATKYRDEVLTILAKKSGAGSEKELKLSSFEAYAADKFKLDQKQKSKANVAVILAEGDVVRQGDGLSSEKLCQELKKVRLNKKIKAVVLRVNSPGGSALASDEIWREVDLLNKKKKVVVSMGDLAASGGYYISCPASYIFADPNTITGSIGVFGMIPFTGKLMQDKLGLSFDQISTNKHAVVSTNRKLTDEEKEIIQREVDQIYDDFLARVSTGRKIEVARANQLGRGRVWLGSDAKKIGLVDELGGLREAITFASKKAGIKDPEVIYYPRKKENPLEKIVEALDEQGNVKSSGKLTDQLYQQYQLIKSIDQRTGIQMRMPFDLIIR
ncbi:MAG: signal peptide peptidase SppA [Bacteroidetes bacterium]|nr:MAG: signal peptide peptidase SppA [Bacteroidota bacterium]